MRQCARIVQGIAMMFPPRFWRYFVLLWITVGTLLGMAIWLDNHRDLLESQPPATTSGLTDKSLVEKGSQLLLLGNCMACHTERGQVAGAGGRVFQTPFGKVYSSNITPDKQYGLGAWNANDFWRALHHGKSKDGRLLTPVFPYQHTTLITREDSDAMFEALKTWAPAANDKPIDKPSATLTWPYGTPVAIAVWRSLFFTPGVYGINPQKSPEWNRGAYLAQGLGHCAACHSERNEWGAIESVHDFSGGLMPVINWYAPSLTSPQETGLAQQTAQDIAGLLQSGRNEQGSTSGPMAEVVQHSTQHWRADDLLAVATYLKEQAQQASPSSATKPADTRASTGLKPSAKVLGLGAKIYDDHCAQCHQSQGQGVPGAYPALAHNRAVLLNDPTNLVQSVLYGGYPVTTTLNPRPFGMPPYILTLDDREIAAVLTHLRTQWGNQAPEVTPLQVNRIRSLQGP
jgi:mono/diheme cytochrome c family protein